MAQLHFVINPEKELEYHKLFKSIRGLEDCSNFESISDEKEVLQKIQEFWNDDVREYVASMQDAWNVINDKYFALLETVTEKKLLYQDYYCYVCSNTITGFSNPFAATSNEFILVPVDLSLSNYLAGHELFHTHYYSVWAELDLSSVSPTLLTEGTAVLGLLFTEGRDLFDANNEFVDSCITSYDTVEQNWDLLLKKWNGRESFNQFLTEMYKELPQ